MVYVKVISPEKVNVMMRWKILELAGEYSSVDEIVAALKSHPEFELEEEAALSILKLYKDTLSAELQHELDEKTGSA